MKFRSGCTYRHDTAKDLDILVVRVRYADEKRSKLLIHWIDMQSGNVRNLPGTSRPDGATTVEIQSTDYKYWKRV